MPIPQEHEPFQPFNKWFITLTVTFGAFMAVMDISVVNVAVPHMMGSFGQNLQNITWVATSYSIAEIIMITMSGWLATLMGRRRLYLASLAIFTVGSILSGTAHNFTQIVIYRTIQGLGGGALLPLAQAILRETFPEEEQGMAMAFYSMAVVLAPMVGPILGGYITDHYGWPWIFYVNVPVAVAAMICVYLAVWDPPYLRRGIGKVDWLGIILLAVGLTFLQIVLERGQEDNWLSSHFIIAGICVTTLSLGAFIAWELYCNEPVFNLRLLKNVPLAIGSLIGVVVGIGLSGSSFILPQFTQQMLGYTAYQAGMVLLPRAVAMFVLMPVAGWMYKYVNGKLMIFAGLCLLAWSYYDLAHLSLEVDFWSLVPMLLLMGAGLPFMFVTLSTLSLSRVDRPDLTAASGIYTLSRRVGGNIGYALVATIVAERSQFHRSRMVGNVSTFSGPFLAIDQTLRNQLRYAGQSALAARQAAMGMIDRMVDRHASMLAYNDVSWILMICFIVTPPLLLFLPKRRRRPLPPIAAAETSVAAADDAPQTATARIPAIRRPSPSEEPLPTAAERMEESVAQPA